MGTMDKAEEMLKIKGRVERLRTFMDKAVGKLEAAVLNAKKEFGTDQIKDLKKLLVKKEKERIAFNKEIQTLNDQIEELLQGVEDKIEEEEGDEEE